MDILKICKSSQTFKCYVTILLTTGWMRLKAFFVLLHPFLLIFMPTYASMHFFRWMLFFLQQTQTVVSYVFFSKPTHSCLQASVRLLLFRRGFFLVLRTNSVKVHQTRQTHASLDIPTWFPNCHLCLWPCCYCLHLQTQYAVQH